MFMGCGALAAPSSAAYVASAMTMHKAMAFELTCDANVDFARGMLAHDRGALDSCQVFLAHAGEAMDPTVKHFCVDHVGPAQTAEVELLTKWLTERGHSLIAPSCDSMRDMACGDLSCTGSKKTLRANQVMHHDMAIRFTGDANLDFVRTMIPHHEGALEMCHILQAHGDDPTLLALCSNVLPSQTLEVGELSNWLLLTGHGEPAAMPRSLAAR